MRTLPDPIHPLNNNSSLTRAARPAKSPHIKCILPAPNRNPTLKWKFLARCGWSSGNWFDPQTCIKNQCVELLPTTKVPLSKIPRPPLPCAACSSGPHSRFGVSRLRQMKKKKKAELNLNETQVTLFFGGSKIMKEGLKETKEVERMRAVYCLAGLSPEVDVFQVAHSGQSTQLQTLHCVPSHGQLVHCTQPLQHSGDVREVVKGKPQAVELGQAPQIFGQGAEMVSIQRQYLQALRKRRKTVVFHFKESSRHLRVGVVY